MWSMRADYAYRLYTMEEVVEQRGRSAGPVVADELADCTLGGSSGDVVTSVRYLLEHHIADSLAVGIVDPESVSHAFSAGVGATVDLSVGGRVCIEANPPLAVRGRVIATGEDVVGHGTVLSGYETRVGKVAVVEQDGIQIVLIERPGKIDGPSFLEPLGIDPAKKAVVVVKEGLLPLVSYASIASAILMVDSPGFCRQHLPSLGYRNVMRPIYPLDLDVTWDLG
jgi:microcystin degradation protein MlrC